MLRLIALCVQAACLGAIILEPVNQRKVVTMDPRYFTLERTNEPNAEPTFTEGGDSYGRSIDCHAYTAEHPMVFKLIDTDDAVCGCYSVIEVGGSKSLLHNEQIKALMNQAASQFAKALAGEGLPGKIELQL